MAFDAEAARKRLEHAETKSPASLVVADMRGWEREAAKWKALAAQRGAVLRQAEAAARKFVDKVESGHARSRETYDDPKTLIASIAAALHEPEG